MSTKLTSKMKNTILCMAAALLACAACKNSGQSSGKPLLAVSIDPQRQLLEAVAGPEFSVTAVMPAGANPETFEPTVAKRMKAAGAEAYFPIGFLPFEAQIESEMLGRTYNSTNGIAPLFDTHSHGDHTHSVPDPHVWTSVPNCIVMARHMADALGAMYPADAAYFAHRADSVAAALGELDAALSSRLADADKTFLVWHPSLSYFARDYGLKQIAVGHESKEVSVGQLASIIEQAKADSVKVLFFQKEFDSRQARNLCDEVGARIVEINPMAYDWQAELTRIVDELAKP